MYVSWYDAQNIRHRNRIPANTENPDAWAKGFLAKRITIPAARADALWQVLEQGFIRITKQSRWSYTSVIRRYERFGMDVEAMKNGMEAEGLSSITKRDYLTKLKTLLSRAVKFGFLPADTDTDFSIPKAQVRPKAIPTLAARDRLFAHLKANDRELYDLCCLVHYAYIRPKEALQLQPQDYLFKRSQIYVPAHVSKNRKAGTVYMIEPLRLALEGRVPMFKSSLDALQRRFRAVAEKLGLDFNLYRLKDAGALAAVRNGLDLLAVRDQCRHSSVSTTERYLKDTLGVVPESLRMLTY